MTDEEIVQAITAGEPEGLAEAYRCYADRLFDYCTRTLADREAAADAVHDTFLIACERVAQLRDPAALRSWLYAIARSRCLRVLRERGRTTALIEEAEVPDTAAEPLDAGPHRAEVRSLVRSALAGLNPREREVLELTLRHELSGPELAAALGVPLKQAHAVASTARGQVERSLGALLLARTRGRDCTGLRSLLAGWDGELSPRWRKRINRHIDSCAECSEQRKRVLTPAALFGASPLLAAPPWLWEKVARTAFEPAHAASRAELARSAGPYREDGFPQPSPPAGALSRPARTALAVAAILAVLFIPGSPGAPTAPGPAAGSASPQPQPPGPTAEALGSGNGTLRPPEATLLPSPEPTASGSREELIWAEGVDTTAPGCVSRWTLRVTAGGGDVASGVLEVDAGDPLHVTMRPREPGVWAADAGGLPVDRPVVWSVALTDGAGHTRTSGPHELSRAGCAEPPEAETEAEEPREEPEEPYPGVDPSPAGVGEAGDPP